MEDDDTIGELDFGDYFEEKKRRKSSDLSNLTSLEMRNENGALLQNKS